MNIYYYYYYIHEPVN